MGLKALAKKVISGLTNTADIPMSGDQLVDRTFTTKATKLQLEQLADKGASQLQQVINAKDEKKLTKDTVDAALKEKNLRPRLP